MLGCSQQYRFYVTAFYWGQWQRCRSLSVRVESNIAYALNGLSSWNISIQCHTLFLKGVNASVMWRETNRDGGRQMQPIILTHNYFFWPYHAVLSSRSHLALLLLLCRGILNWRPTVGLCPSGVSSHLPALLSLTVSSWDWLKTETVCISDGHLPISFHNTHTFLFNHVTAFTFFTSTSCAENLWFTAQSRVNMQQ